MKRISLSICLLFTLSICTVFAQSGGPLFTNAIGVQAYTYRNSWAGGIIPVLDSIKALGITEMEGPNPNNISPEDFKIVKRKGYQHAFYRC